MATGSLRDGGRVRRSPESRNARGTDTRRRILEAAFRSFSTDGYGATSTRIIARAAGVNTPALQYYFGNKAGLYRACVELLAARVVGRLNPIWSRVRERLQRDLDVAELIELFCGIQSDLLDSFYDPDEGPIVNMFRSRLGGQAAEADAGWMIFRENVDRPVFALCAAIAARVTGDPVESFENQANTMALLGLTVTFIHENEDALRTVSGMRDPSACQLSTIKRIVCRNGILLLNALHDSKQNV